MIVTVLLLCSKLLEELLDDRVVSRRIDFHETKECLSKPVCLKSFVDYVQVQSFLGHFAQAVIVMTVLIYQGLVAQTKHRNRQVWCVFDLMTLIFHEFSYWIDIRT